MHTLLQQLWAAIGLSADAATPPPDVLTCLYTAKSSLPKRALIEACALLRSLWGGAALLLQLLPQGFEIFLKLTFQLQELQHLVLHAATDSDPQQKLKEALGASLLPHTEDLAVRSGRYNLHSSALLLRLLLLRLLWMLLLLLLLLLLVLDSLLLLHAVLLPLATLSLQRRIPAVTVVYIHPNERPTSATIRNRETHRSKCSGRQRQHCSSSRQQYHLAAAAKTQRLRKHLAAR